MCTIERNGEGELEQKFLTPASQKIEYNKINVSELFYWSFFSWDPWLCFSPNIECRYSNECNCSYYWLIFITWKYSAMNKSWLWLRNWLRQICNVFGFTFIKHLFKRRDVLHIECLLGKMMNHIVLICTMKFNFKQVTQRPLKFCITWKVVGFLEFYILPG